MLLTLAILTEILGMVCVTLRSTKLFIMLSRDATTPTIPDLRIGEEEA
jgi:hypothetical protein